MSVALERWTETLLYVKNIHEDATLDQLKDIFADAEDVVFAKPDPREKDKNKKYALHSSYLLFPPKSCEIDLILKSHLCLRQ